MKRKIPEKKSIYIIKNTINDKVYIGQSSDPVLRWSQHLYNSRYIRNNTIDKAIHDYGEENFYYQILEKDVENYDERERYWIERYDSLVPNGFNRAKGGKGNGSGIDNPLALVRSERMLLSIKNDLSNSKMSYEKIAKKYGVTSTVILGINNGQYYHNSDLSYPIRESNRYTKERIKQIIYALKYERDKTLRQIADEYKIDYTVLSEINQGKVHVLNPDESYPLRKGKITSITKNDVDKIKELLLGDTPQKDIARIFNISVNAVSQINLGKSYYDESFEYPIRRNYQCSDNRTCFSPIEIDNITSDLRDTNISLRDIAKKYHDDSVIYPIRSRKNWY